MFETCVRTGARVEVPLGLAARVEAARCTISREVEALRTIMYSVCAMVAMFHRPPHR